MESVGIGGTGCCEKDGIALGVAAKGFCIIADPPLTACCDEYDELRNTLSSAEEAPNGFP